MFNLQLTRNTEKQDVLFRLTGTGHLVLVNYVIAQNAKIPAIADEEFSLEPRLKDSFVSVSAPFILTATAYMPLINVGWYCLSIV